MEVAAPSHDAQLLVEVPRPATTASLAKSREVLTNRYMACLKLRSKAAAAAPWYRASAALFILAATLFVIVAPWFPTFTKAWFGKSKPAFEACSSHSFLGLVGFLAYCVQCVAAGATAALLRFRAYTDHLRNAAGYGLTVWLGACLGVAIEYQVCDIPSAYMSNEDLPESLALSTDIYVILWLTGFVWKEWLVWSRLHSLEVSSFCDMKAGRLRKIISDQIKVSFPVVGVCLILYQIFGYMIHPWCVPYHTCFLSSQSYHIIVAILISCVVVMALYFISLASWYCFEAVRAFRKIYQDVGQAVESLAFSPDLACEAKTAAFRQVVGVCAILGSGLLIGLCLLIKVCLTSIVVNEPAWQLNSIILSVLPQSLDVCGSIVCATLLTSVLTTRGDSQADALDRRLRRIQLAKEFQPGDPGWDEEVHKLAGRGFTLRNLIEFYKKLVSNTWNLPQGWEYRPEIHTTADVVRAAIIPLSKLEKCSYAAIMMGHERVRPQNMITHHWNNKFRNLVAVAVADALGDSNYEKVAVLMNSYAGACALERLLNTRPQLLDRTYWICAFSVSQHSIICHNVYGNRDPVTGRLYEACDCGAQKHENDSPPLVNGQSVRCEVNKFADMMEYLAATDEGFKQLIAVDESFQIMKRAWCNAEMAKAEEMSMEMQLMVFSESTIEGLKGEDSWLRRLDVRDMEASRQQDKTEILRSISEKPGIAEFNEAIQQLLFNERKGLLAAWKGLDSEKKMQELGRVLRWQEIKAKMNEEAEAG